MNAIDLTSNLKLTHIEENNAQGDDLLAVCCHFEFYGKHGTGFISINKVEEESPSYGLIESDSDLHASFTDQLDANWEEIAKHVKFFHTDW